MEQDRKDETKHITGSTVPGKLPDTLPSLSIDWKLYESYLDDDDLTDEQKQQFIETLWSIVVSWVDMGFNIHPVQQVIEQREEEFFDSDKVKEGLNDASEHQE